jgi:hypothetical protein
MKDSRLLPLLGMLVLAVVGVAVAVLGLPDRERHQSLIESPAEVGRSGKPAAMPPPPAAPKGAGFDEPQLEVQRVPEAPQVVDSFPPTRHVPLAGWKRTATVAGYFDSLAVLNGNGRSRVIPDRTLDGNAILVASGWAGDPQLGLQLHDTVLSQCDRLIARARVTLDRPDVADAVHPNLGRSGWEAVLHAADLAICADTTLRAWAVLPGRPAVLLPLNGTFRLGSVSAAEAAYHVPALPPLQTADIAPPVVTVIEVNAKRVNLRRCGGTDCPRVDQIEGGRHRAHIADRSDGWSLLVFKDRAGWMADTLYKLAE